MPVVRTTVTRSTTAGQGFRSSSIPVWVIKGISVVIAIVVLVLLAMESKGVRANWSSTSIVIALTCGVLLGWSVGSVLQQLFFMRTVEITVNLLLTVLAVVSLVLTAAFLISQSDYSRSEDYRLMVGIAICFLIQSLVCLMMLSWACYGNIVIVEHR